MKNFLSTHVLVFSIFFSSLSLCMDQQLIPIDHAQIFTAFDNLSTDLQNKVFACSCACDKNSWQKTDKDWKIRGSINVPAVYAIAMHDPFCASEKDTTRILLGACYQKQYDIVQNVLNNSANRLPFYYIHGIVVWDLVGIARHNKDEKMLQLLQNNKVRDLKGSEELKQLWELEGRNDQPSPFCKPSNLQMACFSGDSDCVQSLVDIDLGKEIYLPVFIIAYFDKANCLKVLFNNREKQSNVDSLCFHSNFLHASCEKGSAQVLTLLLNDKNFDVNKIKDNYNNPQSYITLRSFVDAAVILKKNYSETIVAILKKRLAKDSQHCVIY